MMPLPWSPESVRQIAETFLREAGISEPRARLIRFYQNALFHLPDSGLTLRIYGSEDARSRAERMVSFAAFLARRDFPSVRLSTKFEQQPMEILGTPISVWNWIDEDLDGRKQPRAFGMLLRAFHRLTDQGEFRAPRFDPIAKIRNRLNRLADEKYLPASHVDVRQAALQRATSLSDMVDGVTVTTGLVHGDALIGNTVLSNGSLVLLDFDSVGHGAREWDLAPTLVTATRFRQQQTIWTEFLAGYGQDAPSLRGIEAAAVVKQLSMTLALCVSRGLSKEVDDEIDLRIRCWADWDFRTPWHSPSLNPAP